MKRLLFLSAVFLTAVATGCSETPSTSDEKFEEYLYISAVALGNLPSLQAVGEEYSLNELMADFGGKERYHGEEWETRKSAVADRLIELNMEFVKRGSEISRLVREYDKGKASKEELLAEVQEFEQRIMSLERPVRKWIINWYDLAIREQKIISQEDLREYKKVGLFFGSALEK